MKGAASEGRFEVVVYGKSTNVGASGQKGNGCLGRESSREQQEDLPVALPALMVRAFLLRKHLVASVYSRAMFQDEGRQKLWCSGPQ